MPHDPLEGLKKIFLATMWLEKIFLESTSPQTKNPR